MFYKKNSILFVLICCLFSVSCREGQPTAVLEVYILDALGNRVTNANVNIYKFKEDWEKEQNEMKPAEVTTETGLIRFVNLEEGTYYIDVKKGSTNNWEGKIETSVQSIGAFYVNTEFIIVKESRAGDVAQANGRKWKASTLRQFGRTSNIQDLDASFRCTYDNVLIFYKGGRFEIVGSGLKCSASEMLIVERGIWKFNDTGTAINLKSDIREVNWGVLESSPTRLFFQETLLSPIFGSFNIDITYLISNE
jgi:hypothetical protein